MKKKVLFEELKPIKKIKKLYIKFAKLVIVKSVKLIVNLIITIKTFFNLKKSIL